MPRVLTRSVMGGIGKVPWPHPAPGIAAGWAGAPRIDPLTGALKRLGEGARGFENRTELPAAAPITAPENVNGQKSAVHLSYERFPRAWGLGWRMKTLGC